MAQSRGLIQLHFGGLQADIVSHLRKRKKERSKRRMRMIPEIEEKKESETSSTMASISFKTFFFCCDNLPS
jgi:hypothetical protein